MVSGELVILFLIITERPSKFLRIMDLKDIGIDALTEIELQHFEEKGWVTVANAFSPESAAQMVSKIWELLSGKFSIEQHDRSSWHLKMGYGLSELNSTAVFKDIGSDRTHRSIDRLLGKGRWNIPSHWGQHLVTFPSSEDDWVVPTETWHTDFDFAPEQNPFGIMMFAFLSDVKPKGGGTVIIEGSHRLVSGFVKSQPQDQLGKMKTVRRRIMNSNPWFIDLENERDPKRRNNRFLSPELVDDVSVRVVELTGSPGDVILCHPWLLQATAPNCSDKVRMMMVQRIKMKC